MKKYTILLLFLKNLAFRFVQSGADFIGETIIFRGNNGIMVAADFYRVIESRVPFIII